MMRSTCQFYQHVRGDDASSLPIVDGWGGYAPIDRHSCLHVRARDAARYTGCPNLDANGPCAAVRALQYSNNNFRADRATNICHPDRRPTRGDSAGRFARDFRAGTTARTTTAIIGLGRAPGSLRETRSSPPWSTTWKVLSSEPGRSDRLGLDRNHPIRFRRPRGLRRRQPGRLRSNGRYNGLRPRQVILQQITVTRIEYPQERGLHTGCITDHTR